MSLAAHFFCLQIAAGVAAWTFAVSLRSMGRGFHQLHVAIAFAALALSLVDGGGGLAALWSKQGVGELPEWWPQAQLILTFGAGACLLLGAFAYSWRDRVGLVLHGLGALVCVGQFAAELALLGMAARWPGNHLAAAALFVVSGCLGATVLGLATIAMNVGHWFLVNPRLGIGHLEKPTRWLVWSFAARGLTLLAAGFATFQTADLEGKTLSGAILAYGFFEGARAVAGWLFPAVLAWMALKTARIRSTQAATGILYALLLLATIGEGLAWLLIVWKLLPW